MCATVVLKHLAPIAACILMKNYLTFYLKKNRGCKVCNGHDEDCSYYMVIGWESGKENNEGETSQEVTIKAFICDTQ